MAQRYEHLEDIPEYIRGECMGQKPRLMDDGWYVAYAHGFNLPISAEVAMDIRLAQSGAAR